MRKRLLAVLALTGALVSLPIGSASANPASINGHDCAGFVVSSLSGPGFGQAVSAAAHDQVVDNFGLADCGQTNRNNP